jgi:DNA-binding transcriptional LysR family regulator
VDTRLVDIVADGLDAGIRVLGDVPRDMIAIRFGPDMRFAAVASPDYLSRHEPPKAPHDLVQHRCIRFRFESGATYRWDLEHRAKSANIVLRAPYHILAWVECSIQPTPHAGQATQVMCQ